MCHTLRHIISQPGSGGTPREQQQQQPWLHSCCPAAAVLPLSRLRLGCAGLQDLPEDVKRAYEHSASSWNVGWSHGKEALRSGLLDTHKGSFYANPLQVCIPPAAAAKTQHFLSAALHNCLAF